MTVAEFIEFLKKQPQDLQVAYKLYSEFCLLEVDRISIEKLSNPRADGWVHWAREDQPTSEYLLLPGN